MFKQRMAYRIGVIILLCLSTWTVQAQTLTPNPDTIQQDCERDLAPDRSIPTGPDAPSIKIIAPATKTIVTSTEPTLADVDIKVEVHHWNLPGYYTDDPAPHWHLWLNDSVWGMSYQTDALSGIPYGTWRVCVSLSDADHKDVGMPDAILLTVEKQSDQTVAITTQPATAQPPLTAVAKTEVAQPPATNPPSTAVNTPPAVVVTPSAATDSQTDSPDPMTSVVIVSAGIVVLGAGFMLGARRTRKSP